MNHKRTTFRAALAGLLLVPCYAFSAEADKAAQAKTDNAATSGATGDAASIIERKQLDITRDEEKAFGEMERGGLSQDDFERMMLDLSYRYDELISRDPHNINTLIFYGKFLRRIGKNDQANVMFVHADQLSPDIAVVKQQLGNFMAEEGNYPEAFKYYQKAIDLAPKEAVYHYGMGELIATFRDKFIADGEFSEKDADARTLSEFAKASELDPSNKDFAFRMGEAYYDVAVPDWNAVLEVWIAMSKRSDLTSYERDAVRLHTARVFCELGKGREARELLREDVVPILRATRARLLKRLSNENTSAEDKANAEVMAPSKSDGAKNQVK
jgi:tetratricopeptide (TPR) repeat protein